MRTAFFALLGLALVGASLPSTAPAPTPDTGEYELVPIPESAVHHGGRHAPRLRQANGTSTNWSGYAVPAGTTTWVKGSWTVPQTTPTASATTYSSSWVGIDGYDTNTVEQLGTEDDSVNGTERHYAWYEMYPRSAYLIKNFPVEAGDQITAEVKSLGRGSYQLSITNATKNKTFTTKQKSGSAKNGSAEWVVEAPWSGGVLPLADFGTVSFTGCQATIDGVTRYLGDAAWTSTDAITMASGSTDKAVPSSASAGAFSVTWFHE
jgi:hypothetical protein